MSNCLTVLMIECDGIPYKVEYVARRTGEMITPPWPVCGSSETMVRTLNGAHWFRQARGYCPQPWQKMETPQVQPRGDTR